jgi:hypothetical protein
MSWITYGLILWVGFVTALFIGAGIAKLLGYKLNEPEYYDDDNSQ